MSLLQIDNKKSNNPFKNRNNINRGVSLNTFTEPLLLARTPVMRTGNKQPLPLTSGAHQPVRLGQKHTIHIICESHRRGEDDKCPGEKQSRERRLRNVWEAGGLQFLNRAVRMGLSEEPAIGARTQRRDDGS